MQRGGVLVAEAEALKLAHEECERALQPAQRRVVLQVHGARVEPSAAELLDAQSRLLETVETAVDVGDLRRELGGLARHPRPRLAAQRGGVLVRKLKRGAALRLEFRGVHHEVILVFRVGGQAVVGRLERRARVGAEAVVGAHALGNARVGRAHDRLESAEEGLEPAVLQVEADALVDELAVQLRARDGRRLRQHAQRRPELLRELLEQPAALQQRQQRALAAAVVVAPAEPAAPATEAAQVVELRGAGGPRVQQRRRHRRGDRVRAQPRRRRPLLLHATAAAITRRGCRRCVGGCVGGSGRAVGRR